MIITFYTFSLWVRISCSKELGHHIKHTLFAFLYCISSLRRVFALNGALVSCQPSLGDRVQGSTRIYWKHSFGGFPSSEAKHSLSTWSGAECGTVFLCVGTVPANFAVIGRCHFKNRTRESERIVYFKKWLHLCATLHWCTWKRWNTRTSCRAGFVRMCNVLHWFQPSSPCSPLAQCVGMLPCSNYH